MLRVVDQPDVSRLRILRRLIRHDSPAVVILLRAARIRTVYEKPQPASFRDAPLKKCEVVKDVFLDLSRRDELFLPQ